jgi:hypothetical protein
MVGRGLRSFLSSEPLSPLATSLVPLGKGVTSALSDNAIDLTRQAIGVPHSQFPLGINSQRW